MASSKLSTARIPLPKSGSPRKRVSASAPAAAWGSAGLSRAELSEGKRLALIRAAGLAFKEKGFHNTSLEDVAAALNVTKPTLYYYAKGKQDLLYQCHDHALDLGEESLKYAMEGSTGLERLQRSLTKYIELITNDFYAYSLLSDLKDLDAERRIAIQKRRRRFDTLYRQFVKEGIEDGSIRPCDPKMATFWFMGAVNAIPRWYSPQGEADGNEVARLYVDFITHGLQAEAARSIKRTR